MKKYTMSMGNSPKIAIRVWDKQNNGSQRCYTPIHNGKEEQG